MCALCHGDKLQGNPTAGIGGDKLIGGRGTLTSATPVKTVESYWPYATTLFDYVKRSMPFTAPGSLSNEQVYNVVAYILGEANIVPKNAALDAKSLPGVQMPIEMASCPTRGQRSSSSAELADTQLVADRRYHPSTAAVQTRQAAHVGCEGFAACRHARHRVPRTLADREKRRVG